LALSPESATPPGQRRESLTTFSLGCSVITALAECFFFKEREHDAFREVVLVGLFPKEIYYHYKTERTRCVQGNGENRSKHLVTLADSMFFCQGEAILERKRIPKET
jgi:hypothetical protein